MSRLRRALKTFAARALCGFVLSLNGWVPAEADAPPAPAADFAKAPIDRSAQAEARLTWWRSARFGIFIHFGVYAIPAKGEWHMFSEQVPIDEYTHLKDQFRPEPTAIAHWADVVKAAGARYAVLTAKHHDGFALFDSHAPDQFNSMNSAGHIDVVRIFAESMRENGIHVGIYYSPLDWRYPGYFFPELYRPSAVAMREKYHMQMKELLSNYGPIDVIWYDGGNENWLGFGGLEGGPSNWHNRDKSKPYTGGFSYHDTELEQELRRLQPNFLMSDRTSAIADFRTREGIWALGSFDDKVPWELATTLAGAWGYQAGQSPMPLTEIIRLLANVVGRDGNLLLNVGPRADGAIEPAQADRLAEVGRWLNMNGDSIYDTRGGPYLPIGKEIVSTRKDRRIFVHVLNGAAHVDLPSLGTRVMRVTTISGERVHFTDRRGRLTLDVPQTLSGQPDAIIVLHISGPALSLRLIAAGSASARIQERAATSE